MRLSVETQIHLNKFQPRPYQLPILDALENKGYRRILAILPRRAGKDLACWMLTIRQALRRVGIYWYILPTYAQGRKVIFDGMTNDSFRFLDFLPHELVEAINQQQMKITLKNGSLIQVIGSDNVDSLVGANPIGCVFSEYSLQDPRAYQYIRPMLTANGGWAVFISTPRGKNSLWELYQIALNNPQDWFAYKMTVEETGHISLHDIERERASGEMSEDLIQQEYFCFPGIQEVMCLDKVRPIQEIKINDMVIAHTGRARKVVGTIGREYKGELIKIKTYGSPEDLVCTPNHPIRVYHQATQTYTWKKAKDIQLADRLVFPKMPLGKLPVISYELCMLLAWYICEGSSFKNGLQFTVGKQEEIDRIVYLLRTLNVEFSLYPSSEANSTNIVVNAVQLVDFFKATCGTKANDKRIPLHLIASFEDDFFHELIKGDGCHSLHKNHEKFVFTTVSKTLAYQVQLLANSLRNYAAGIHMREGKPVRFPHGKTYMTQQSYVISIYIPARRAKESHLIRAKYGIGARIKTIERVPFEGTVYNIKIQYDESYIVAGRAVHNCSFEMGVEGAYYAKYLDRLRLNNQIGAVPWESSFKVHTAWDLGVRDSTAIIFFQTIGQTVRIIDYYEKNKEGLEHYSKVLESKPYTYGRHIAPHDIAVREFGSGMTRLEKARQLGIKFTVAPDLSIIDGIETVRSTLNKMWIDEAKCAVLIKALENYRQEYDVKKKVYKTQPLHNWASHACFTGDTLILTRSGMRPIMSIDKGEEILTLQGWKPCNQAMVMRKNASLVEITFQDGTRVKCTPDHLFLTENGWKSAKSLNQHTKIQSSLTNLPPTLMAPSIDCGQVNVILQKGDLPSIEIVGDMLSALFQRVVTFIIGITIPRIMRSGISSVYRQQITLSCRAQMLQVLLRKHWLRLPNGINQQREDCGTSVMLLDQRHGPSGSVKSAHVFTVKTVFNALLEKMGIRRSFATITAKPLIIESVKSLDETQDVYCINVPEVAHFSLSNGAIVHNSDAARYLCVSLPKTRDGLSAQELDKRYHEAVYGHNANMPSVFRTDLPDY